MARIKGGTAELGCAFGTDAGSWAVGGFAYRGRAMNNEYNGLEVNNETGQRKLMHRKGEKEVEEGAAKATVNEDSQVLLPKEAQGRIGQHLRRIYGEILSEPLPDKFSQLLDNLAKTERSE